MASILKEKKQNELFNLVENSMQSESYLTSLHKENIHLTAQIKKLNDIVSKLKSQISNYEIEKKGLISNASKKDNDLKEIKNKLANTKKEVETLKKKIYQQSTGQKTEENQKNLNEILQKNKNENQNQIVQLQNKITDLEFQLKSKENNCRKNRYILPLINDKNISLSIINDYNKIQNYNNNILNTNSNNSFNSNKIFLTGKNELIELKEINTKLNNQLSDLKNELNSNQEEKIKLNLQLQKLQEEHNKLLSVLNKKNEEINNKLNQQSKLSNNLISELNNNIQMRKNFEKIKIKYSSLEHSKKELENVIIIQENKVKELTNSVENISKLISAKDKEIQDNKSYINNLENAVRQLSGEFRIIRNKRSKDAEKKIASLKSEISSLKNKMKENMEAMGFRNNLIYYKINKNMNSNLEDSFNFEPSFVSLRNIKGRNVSLFSKRFNDNRNRNLKSNIYKKDLNISIRKIANGDNSYRFDSKRDIFSVENGMDDIKIKSTEDGRKGERKKVINSYSSRNILIPQIEKSDKESVNNFKNFLDKIIDDLDS